MSEETQKEVSELLMDIEKTFGEGSATPLNKIPAKVPVVSSGILSLDMAMQIGGIPRGRIVSIYGPESSGKTTMALQIAAEFFKLGEYVFYADVEQALDPEYINKFGMEDSERFVVSSPPSGDECLQIVDKVVRSGLFGLVVIDSTAALCSRAELEGQIGDANVAMTARLMSQALRMITAVLSKSGTTIIFISQLRDKIGISYGGASEAQTGGRSLKFYASACIDIRRISQIKDGDNVVGYKSKVVVVKNKLGVPYKRFECDLIFGEGFSPYNDIIELSVTKNIVEKGGAWFSYEGGRYQGRANLKQALIESPELFTKLENEVRTAYGV